MVVVEEINRGWGWTVFEGGRASRHGSCRTHAGAVVRGAWARHRMLHRQWVDASRHASSPTAR